MKIKQQISAERAKLIEHRKHPLMQLSEQDADAWVETNIKNVQDVKELLKQLIHWQRDMMTRLEKAR